MSYIDDIARQIQAEIDPVLLPDQGDLRKLMRLYALLALVAGQYVTRRDVHNAWAAWMSEIEPDHESLDEFEDLSPDVREEDEPFVKAIRTVAGRLRASSG
jgi:hypothetical protein